MEVSGFIDGMLNDEGSRLTLLLVGLMTALGLFYFMRTKANKYPPGPFAFPVVGNLPQLALCGSVPNFANRYRKSYGDVITLAVGKTALVLVSGYDAMHQLLIKNGDVTSTRNASTQSKFIRENLNGIEGLVFAPFPQWKTLRKLAISTLKEKGMGKATLEPKIQEEIELFISTFLEPKLGKPIQMKENLMLATSNVISQMVFNTRSDYNDGNFRKLVVAMEQVTAVSIQLTMLESLPDAFSRWFTGPLVKKQIECIQDIITPALQNHIDKHKTDLDEENPRDLTDRFLIRAAAKDSESFFSDSTCFNLVTQIYAGGSDSTAGALSWAFLFMCLHPEKQQRVQQEIDDVLGREKFVSCKDRLNMPYTDAVLLETLRKGNVSPLSIPHIAEKDLVVGKTSIPAGAVMMFNMSSALNDETVFEEPDKFKPERYLTGDIALKKQRAIAFGLGPRACLGESLAKMELFLFFTTFLQRYRVHLPAGSTAKDERIDGVVSPPKPYDIIFQKR